MSRTQLVGLALVAVLVAVVAFLLIRGYGDEAPDEGSTDGPRTSAPPGEASCGAWPAEPCQR